VLLHGLEGTSRQLLDGVDVQVLAKPAVVELFGIGVQVVLAKPTTAFASRKAPARALAIRFCFSVAPLPVLPRGIFRAVWNAFDWRNRPSRFRLSPRQALYTWRAASRRASRHFSSEGVIASGISTMNESVLAFGIEQVFRIELMFD